MSTKITDVNAYEFGHADEQTTLHGLLQILADDLGLLLNTYEGDNAEKFERDLVNARAFLEVLNGKTRIG